MRIILKVYFSILFLLVNFTQAFAADFDEDGLDDFILIDISETSELNWYAIDLNDNAQRFLGAFGAEGNHLALGNWTADGKSSLGYVDKNDSGAYVWYLGLPTGLKTITLGNDPDRIISGLDYDKNGAIDPVSVTVSDGKLIWKILSNPAIESSAAKEFTFGAEKDVTFYADIDGTGDKLGIARLNKKKILALSFLDPATGNIRKIKVRNFQGSISAVYPVASDTGEDYLYILDKTGSKYKFTIISDGIKLKKVNIAGDEVVVGKYFDNTSEALVVRTSTSKGSVVKALEKKSELEIDLEGILVDEINNNTFGIPTSPIVNPPASPTPPTTNPEYPVCSGVMNSTEYLLYKPVSDTTGNAVIVFDSKFSRELVSVKLELKDGSFTDAFWKGLLLWGNPDAGGNRQHWRTNVRASQVKDNALIIANDGTQECKFMIPGSANKRWE